MSQVDPPRLDSLEEAPELSEMLRSAQDFGPGADVVSRLAANLGLPPPGGGGGGGGAGAPASPLASGAPPAVAPPVAAAASVKLGIAAFVAGAAVAGLVVFGPGSRGDAVPSAPVAVAPSAPVAVEPPAPSSVPPAPPQEPPAVVPEAPPAPAPSPAASARGVRAPAEKPSEVELVGRAQKALREDPARALALTSEHRQLYPRGTLAQEREVLAIEALAALGRGDAARARAAAFESATPGSPYAVRVARAIKKTEP